MTGHGINGPHLRPEELVSALHDRPEVTTQNDRGEWVPAIPLPFYSWFPRYRCPDCHAAYWTRPGYRGHYALAHILGTP